MGEGDRFLTVCWHTINSLFSLTLLPSCKHHTVMPVPALCIWACAPPRASWRPSSRPHSLDSRLGLSSSLPSGLTLPCLSLKLGRAGGCGHVSTAGVPRSHQGIQPSWSAVLGTEMFLAVALHPPFLSWRSGQLDKRKGILLCPC